MDHVQASDQPLQGAPHGAETGAETEVKASTRPSVSALLPTTDAPETPEQRMGVRRNGAYQEHVTVRRVDPQEAQAEQARRRGMRMLGLEVALALTLTLAARIWGWAQEERARARVDRELRQRLTAS